MPISKLQLSRRTAGIGLLTLCAALGTGMAAAPARAETKATATAKVAATARVRHRYETIDGVKVFYREAGDRANPTILLLHGFPTSSQMFRNLIPVLAKSYHVLAPDYPGYGASDMPAREKFAYTFANMAVVVDKFLKAKGVERFSVYLMDYGAPVGYRVFAMKPERVQAFIVQNGNAYIEGLQKFWDPIKAYWQTAGDKERNALRQFLTIGATQWQYTHGQPDPSLISPDTWFNDQYLLDRPGNAEIQLDMFYDYRTNVPLYPEWQALFRKHQPPTLIVWGAGDEIFPPSGAHPYLRDLPKAQLHILDGGHFALESHGEFIAEKILAFMKASVPGIK